MRALKFGLVGIANTALDFVLFGLLTVVFEFPAIPANMASYSAGIALSFTLNRSWTFRDRSQRQAWRQLLLFATGSLAGLALSTLVVALLAPAWGPLPAKTLSIGVTFAWNYVFANFIVFKPATPARNPDGPSA